MYVGMHIGAPIDGPPSSGIAETPSASFQGRFGAVRIPRLHSELAEGSWRHVLGVSVGTGGF